jgi:hypothetical protein
VSDPVNDRYPKGSHSTPVSGFPETARAAMADLLGRLDRELPGRIEGFYVAGRFGAAEPGFDVNPVTWHTLARHGIAVRGPEPRSLGIRTDSAELTQWTMDNLNGYWRRWQARARRPGPATLRALPRRFAAWGVLGAPRLHYTLTTGEVTSKEAAGSYALETFAPEWRGLIEEALAFWRGAPAVAPYRRRPDLRRRAAAAFVAHVIERANRLPSAGARVPNGHRPAPGTAPRAR